jgi:hypothetical protein
MKQVFYAEPMEENLTIGKELYEVVRVGNDGKRQKTDYRYLTRAAAEDKARELNEEYNNQI